MLSYTARVGVGKAAAAWEEAPQPISEKAPCFAPTPKPATPLAAARPSDAQNDPTRTDRQEPVEPERLCLVLDQAGLSYGVKVWVVGQVIQVWGGRAGIAGPVPVAHEAAASTPLRSSAGGRAASRFAPPCTPRSSFTRSTLDQSSIFKRSICAPSRRDQRARAAQFPPLTSCGTGGNPPQSNRTLQMYLLPGTHKGCPDLHLAVKRLHACCCVLQAVIRQQEL